MSYSEWLEGLDAEERLAWDALRNTHAALRLAGMLCSKEALRDLAAEQFGNVCLAGLPA